LHEEFVKRVTAKTNSDIAAVVIILTKKKRRKFCVPTLNLQLFLYEIFITFLFIYILINYTLYLENMWNKLFSNFPFDRRKCNTALLRIILTYTNGFLHDFKSEKNIQKIVLKILLYYKYSTDTILSNNKKT